MKLPVSVFVITKNEEHNIGRMLKSVELFSEVILVDSGSTDNTIDIARRYGATVFSQDWLGYSKQKQFAMSLCSNEWVLNLDGDEELTPALITDITSLIKQDDINAVRFTRDDIFIGKTRPAFMKRQTNLRLYRKKFSSFDPSKKVHESATVEGKVIVSENYFIHYGYDNIQALIEKNNRYSSLRIEEKIAKGKKFSPLKLSLILPLEFLRKFVFQRYFLFGWRGFVLSAISANYAFLKEAKLLEHQLKTTSTMEKRRTKN